MTTETGKASSDVINFVQGLQAETLQKLYACPGSCVAIFRFLPPLSQQIILRLSFIRQGIPDTLINSWYSHAYKTESAQAIETLVKLRILQSEPKTDESSSGDWSNSQIFYRLNETFQNSFQNAQRGMVRSLSNLENAQHLIESKHQKSLVELLNYAVHRWECLLQFLALPSSDSSKEVSQDMRKMMAYAGFTREPSNHEDNSEQEITSLGFQFLLIERHKQLWGYLFKYLEKMKKSKGEDEAVKCLSFLFRLGFCRPDGAYSTQGLDELGDFIQHLRELGLIYVRKRKEGWFYATPFVKLLQSAKGLNPSHLKGITGGNSSGKPGENVGGGDGPPSKSKKSKKSKDNNEEDKEQTEDGFLVVETNFRVYAYTSSLLQLAILSTFTDISYRFPNMAVATLSRDSVRRAFQVGITAQQILEYLKTHSKNLRLLDQKTNNSELPIFTGDVITPAIPSSISDQMYSQFDSESDFVKLRDFAAERGILEWDNPDIRHLIVTQKGHDEVKKFWKQQKSGSG